MTPSPAPATSRLDASRWPASKIEMWPVADLSPYVKNARTHPQEQVNQIAASMERFGFTIPMLVAENGTIIAGHGRLMAAAQLGMAEVPVMVARGWSDEDRRLYTLADNRLAETSEWDPETLQVEWDELNALGLGDDLSMIGFSDEDLKDILPAALLEVTGGLTDPDDVPEVDEDQPITKPGDIWALGKHRLCCGDATDPLAVAKLMQGEQATLMFTSPPYAQQRDYGAAKEKVGDWDALMQCVFATAPITDDAQLLVNLGLVHRDREWQPYWEGWVEWMRSSGWRRFGWYVWDQGPGLPGDWNGRLAPSHEFIFHFNRAPRKPHKTVPSKHAGEVLGGGGLRRADGTVHAKTGTGNAIQSHRIPDSVFRIMRHKGGLGAAGSHPAVFPVALVDAVLTAFSDTADLIYEPFCGSGTQIVAAETTGRRCYAVELNPAYVDVAVRRWQEYTGRDAVLEGSGETFAETMAARLDGEPEEDAA